MTKLSTKNIGEPAEVGTDFIKKVIQPGKQQLKILEVTLDKNDQYGDKIILRCETLPVGGPFVGFPVDKNTPNGDCYLGQVGAISLTRWGLKDFTSAGGVFYSKIDECLKNIKMLCVNLGLSDWLDAQEGKHDTIDDYIDALNVEKPFTGIKPFPIPNSIA